MFFLIHTSGLQQDKVTQAAGNSHLFQRSMMELSYVLLEQNLRRLAYGSINCTSYANRPDKIELEILVFASSQEDHHFSFQSRRPSF